MTSFVKDQRGHYYRFDRFQSYVENGDVIAAEFLDENSQTITIQIHRMDWRDAVRDAAPIIPAAPDHYVIYDCYEPDGSISAVKAGIVAWRRTHGLTVPVTAYCLNEPEIERDLWPPVLFPDGHVELGDGSSYRTLDSYLEDANADRGKASA